MKYIIMLGVLLFSISCQAADDDERTYPEYVGDDGKYSRCDLWGGGGGFVKGSSLFSVSNIFCKEGQFVLLLEIGEHFKNGKVLDAVKVPYKYNYKDFIFITKDNGLGDCTFKGEKPQDYYILGKDTYKIAKRISSIDYNTTVSDINLKLKVDTEKMKLVPLENEIISCNVFHSDSY